MNYRVIDLIFLLLLHLSSGYIIDLSAQSNCNSFLVTLSTGDRCEGVYIKELSGTTHVVSLTESFERYNLNSGELRAQGLKTKLYYRMDTYLPAGSKSYSWPTNFLASLNIVKSDIGIVGMSQIFSVCRWWRASS